MTTRQHAGPDPAEHQSDTQSGDHDRHDTDSLEELRDRAAARDRDRAVDDEANPADDPDALPVGFSPAADLLDADNGTEPAVRIVPRQADEFTCTRCFLIAHLSRRTRTNPDICRDCA